MRLPLAFVTLAVTALVQAPAHAAPQVDHGCSFEYQAPEIVVAGHHAGDRTRYHGAVYSRTVVTDGTTPVGATVTCRIVVNGVTVASYGPVHGTTLIAGAWPAEFTADPYDVIQLCTDVAYDSGGSETLCPQDSKVSLWPQVVVDAVDGVLGSAEPYVAAAACPVTGDGPANREVFGVYNGPDGYGWGFNCAR